MRPNMTMPTRLRKFTLVAHITSSVGWIGAVTAFLSLAVVGVANHGAETARATFPAMDIIARFVIVPFALASSISGIIQSLGTEWGLFRHYWVLTKLAFTALATVVLLQKMPLIAYAAGRAVLEAMPAASLPFAGKQLLVHAAGGIMVLLVVTSLSVLKPWGLTPYGRKRQERRNELPRPMRRQE